MGQAKQRGTFEERKALAIARREAERLNRNSVLLTKPLRQTQSMTQATLLAVLSSIGNFR